MLRQSNNSKREDAVRTLLLLSLACMSAPSAAQQVEVGEGNWSAIPQVRIAGHGRMSDRALDSAAELLGRGGACATGTSKIDMTVPFLLEFDPDGQKVRRVVVRRSGCPALEKLIGGVVLTLAKQGEYRASGENLAHWYRGQISFAIN
jgi:hypothetical protein